MRGEEKKCTQSACHTFSIKTAKYVEIVTGLCDKPLLQVFMTNPGDKPL